MNVVTCSIILILCSSSVLYFSFLLLLLHSLHILRFLINNDSNLDLLQITQSCSNISLFTSANCITYTALSPSASYQFDYKSGILQFTTTTVPSNRVYATVYQYVGRMLSDPNDIVALSITASNISASGYITSSNVYVENTITADTGSFIYLNINNTGSAPTNYTSSGMTGEVRFDNNFIYIYTNNVWVRTPIVRWTD